ncbi:hypothetical protein [Cellulomonas sp. PSBB021]|uniref:hypothetical protein n=1 Tax=Cellulomonas sp. PSBB021 TaxID=2003551 RepID=UPI000B8DA034|nr:hypothetical protein [Cellulomonas sp. PSBB021]ASR56295.1 hypothetical protein CBP52_15640 [Cellulomonas sp. PSBB021]
MSGADDLFEAAVGLRDRERSALCHLFAQQRDASAAFPDRRDTEALWASLVDVLHEAGLEARRRRQRLDDDFARVIGVTAVPLPGTLGASRTRAGDPPGLQGRSSAHDALDGEPRATDDPATSEES